jgi:hypothetical protein
MLYRDGLPLAMLAGGEVTFLERLGAAEEWDVRNAVLRRGPTRTPTDSSLTSG